MTFDGVGDLDDRLGACVIGIGAGSGTARFSNFAISSTAFCVSSPHFKVGMVGGLVKIEIMSDVACRKKSSRVTLGKGITVGKFFTVSACRTRWVDGM